MSLLRLSFESLKFSFAFMSSASAPADSASARRTADFVTSPTANLAEATFFLSSALLSADFFISKSRRALRIE